MLEYKASFVLQTNMRLPGKNISYCRICDTDIFIDVGMYYFQQYSCTALGCFSGHLTDKCTVPEIGIIDAVILTNRTALKTAWKKQ